MIWNKNQLGISFFPPLDIWLSKENNNEVKRHQIAIESQKLVHERIQEKRILVSPIIQGINKNYPYQQICGYSFLLGKNCEYVVSFIN